MTVVCPKCEKETSVPPMNGKYRCFGCGNRWPVPAPAAPAPPQLPAPSAAGVDMTMTVGAFLMAMRARGARVVLELMPAELGGGVIRIGADSIEVGYESPSDSDLVLTAFDKLDRCIAATGGRQ